MECTYTLTQQDIFEAIIATRNRKKWVKWCFRIIIPVSLILVGLSIFAFPLSKLAANVLPLLAFLFIWLFMTWGSPWLVARTQFLKSPSLQGERTALFHDNGVQWNWDGGSSSVEWKTYIRWMETKNDVLLFTSPIQCAIVPKRALNTELLFQLRNLLSKHVAAGGRV